MNSRSVAASLVLLSLAAGAIGVTGMSSRAWAGNDGTDQPAAPPAPVPTSAPKPSEKPGEKPTDKAPGGKPAPGSIEESYAAADAVDDALTKAVASVQTSSVTVRNLKRRPPEISEGPDFVMASGGSGVVISWKGQGPFVITNVHVARGADRLEIVTFDGQLFEMKLRDQVDRYDIALLEFAKDKPPKACKCAKFGKSEQLKEGQWVIATGNPFFLALDGRCVATLGVVSGLDRTLRGDFTYANAIQHDAEVNPGNSGGPLWNLAGELIGINGMISARRDNASPIVVPSNTGASYAIPIHLVAGYLDSLVSEKVAATAGYLGVDLADQTDPATRKPLGATINAIANDSPLMAKGQKGPVPVKGDVVTRVSLGASAFSLKSYDVYCASDVTNALAFYGASTKVKIRYKHGGKEFTWDGELSAAQPPPRR